MQTDFLAIGDIVTEPFIRLKDARVHCTINDESCEICMRWGDKIPYDYDVPMYAVGNASNAAVSAARLGLGAALRAYIGDDLPGKMCVDKLTEEKVDTSFMVTEAGKQTNHHYVLWYETERTILVKHETFTYTVPESAPPAWVYLSSLADNSLPYHLTLAAWLKEHPDTKLAFQPGTFQMKLGKDALKDIYARTELFVCNKAEAERILEVEPTLGHSSATGEADYKKKLLASLQALGPKIVVITDDRKGAYAADTAGHFYFVPMYPDVREPKERTGAGDAFASTVAAALALGKPLEEALLWGPINAMSVVQEVGAQQGLLTRAQLEQYLKDAPATYKLESL